MSSDQVGSDFANAVQPIIRKLIENIDSAYVWMPLGLFVLCILAISITQLKEFGYAAMAFLILAFGADWVGRFQNRQPVVEIANAGQPDYRNEVFTYLAGNQAKAVGLLENGKVDAARALIDQNLRAADQAVKVFPDDADFHAILGYTLKDIYQSSKGLLSPEQRKGYLERARNSFATALRIDSRNASAQNGMGNVLFFEGRLVEAIAAFDRALALTHGKYPAAEHDRRLALAVKAGEIPFDF